MLRIKKEYKRKEIKIIGRNQVRKDDSQWWDWL
jgi:hypothetical protein